MLSAAAATRRSSSAAARRRDRSDMSDARSNGIVIGVVADLDDPDRLGRARVQFPHLGGKLSDWARVVAPMAGKGRGFYFRPVKGDEMLVIFEHSDTKRSYVCRCI